MGVIGGKTDIQRINSIEKSLFKVLKRDFTKSFNKGIQTLSKKSVKYFNLYINPLIRSGFNSIWQNVGIGLIYYYAYKNFEYSI